MIINIAVWSLVPLLRLSLPLDTQEALIWGRDYFLGTPKHPPFSGWLAWPFYTVFLKFEGAMYLLSQLCVATGLIYIYRLAKQFVGEQKAVLATMLQFGIIYYDFSSVEYNVNVVSLSLWPMCAFYFWQAYKDNKWGVVDSTGNTVIDPSYKEMIIVRNSKKGIFICTYDVNYENGEYKTKVLNEKNEEILKDYDKIEAISNIDNIKEREYYLIIKYTLSLTHFVLQAAQEPH